MKKIIFLLFVLLSANLILPQSTPPGIPRIYTEIYSFPSDSGTVIYYSYRIPNNFLIFEKSDSGFKAGYSLGLEVSDSLSKSIKRAYSENEVILNDFEKTNSSKDFEEGVIELKIGKGKYNVFPFFTDKSSVKEFKLKPQVVTSVGSKTLTPIVVDETPVECNNNRTIEVANYGGDIPFSEAPYSIIIPVKDTTVKELNLRIINGFDTVFSGKLNESFTAGIKLTQCSKKIILEFSKNNATKNFVIKNLSQKLYEGPLTIMELDSANKISNSFSLSVVWANKPFALMNYEFAIKSLRNIEKEELVDSLLSLSPLQYQKALFDYWKKYDKTPATKYNQLMAEFYARVDYSAINFRTISNKSGVETDRGKTFIKFGKPSKTDRSSSDKGKIVETWYYDSTGLVFSFVDKNGNGDFTLIKQQ